MSITGCEFRSATFSGVVTSVVKFIGFASPHWTLEGKRRALDNASAETHHVLYDWLREAFKLLRACETVAVSRSNTETMDDPSAACRPCEVVARRPPLPRV